MANPFKSLVSMMSKAPSKPQETAENIIWNVIGARSIPKRGSFELVQAYKNTPWLRSVCSRVATDVASTRWCLYMPAKQDGKSRKMKHLQRGHGYNRAKQISKASDQGEVIEIVDHPLLDMLHHGNKMLPGHSAMEVSQLHLDIQGEAFWYLDKFADTPIAYWPIPPNWVTKVPTPSDPTFTLQYNGAQHKIPVTDMLWFKYPDPANPFGRGTGVAESMGDELDTDEYATAYIKGFFMNNGVPDALIGLKGATKETLQAAKQAWDQRYRGSHNAHQVAFHNGEVTAEVLSHTFRDQQVVELRQAVRDTIIQIFGVPPECVGVIENSNRATIEAATYIMARYVTTPRLERIRDVLQDRLVPMFDDRLILEYESPIPDDRNYYLEVMKAQPSTVTRAEWRAAAGLPSNGDIDEVYLMETGKSERSIYDPDLWVSSEPIEEPAPEVPEPVDPTEDPEPEEDEDEDEDEEDYELSARPRVRKAGRQDIEEILFALEAGPLSTELTPVINSVVETWGAQTLTQLGIGSAFEMLNPRVVEHLNALALENLENVTDTTREKLRDQLIEGVQAGEGSRQLASRVRGVFDDANSYRATRIARTEVLRSSNFGIYEAQLQAGIVAQRQWVSTTDERTRESHQDLNGQLRGIGEPFEVDGKSAMYPGDFGDPAEDVNCRCTTIPVITSPKAADELATVWKGYDAQLRPHEKKARSALRRGFAEQLDAVLEALYDTLG